MSLNLTKLPKKGWLLAHETVRVMKALRSFGADVRFVGGCVRDTILGRTITDIDIGTPDTPKTVIQLLTNAKIQSIPTGIKHGTVTAIVNGCYFQITTLRRDLQTDGRHATVEYTDKWLEDARRRDFTINCLSVTHDGMIFDPFNGVEHITEQRVVFVGRPEDRIKEDYLRILRFYRFNGLFSREVPDCDGSLACKNGAMLLKDLSKERVRDEIFRILLVDDPATIASRMHKDGVFDIILPQAKNIPLLEAVNSIETQLSANIGIKYSPIRHLAALIDPVNDDLTNLMTNLKLSKNQGKHLSDICNPKCKIHPDMGSAAEKEVCQKINTEELIDLIVLQWGRDSLNQPSLEDLQKDKWLAFLSRCKAWSPLTFPLTGKDVLNRGVLPGRTVGVVLKNVEKWWEINGFKANRETCLAQMERQIRLMKENN